MPRRAGADRDAVDAAAEGALHGEALPVRRQAGAHEQALVGRAHAQQPLGAHAEHPGRGAGVPGPAAAAVVGRVGAVHVAGRDVGLDLVEVGLHPAQDGAERAVELPGRLARGRAGTRPGWPTSRRGCRGRRSRASRARSA